MPRVGSSSTSRAGSAHATAASATRVRSPPERSRGLRSRSGLKIELVDGRRGQPRALVTVDAEAVERVVDLLGDGVLDEVGVGVLAEDGAVASGLGDAQAAEVAAQEAHAAGQRPGEAVEVAHQGGLAGAVLAHEGDELAGAQA